MSGFCVVVGVSRKIHRSKRCFGELSVAQGVKRDGREGVLKYRYTGSAM